MLLYTKNANNVFDFVDEKFGNRDISPVPAPSRASPLPQETRSGTRFVDTIHHCGSGLAREEAGTASIKISRQTDSVGKRPVSYTHLTLPTKA